MDDPAREYVVSFYDRTLRMFGDRPESLGWTPGGQLLHYESMLDIVQGTVPIYDPTICHSRKSRAARDASGIFPKTKKDSGQAGMTEYETDVVGSLNGKKILDFGCGKGDLYGFIRDRGITANYAGFDVNENMICLAKEKFPGARFEVFDIEKDDLVEEFDYILLCGVFNLNVGGVDELIRFSLKKLFSRTRIGLAFNALSSHNPNREFNLHYVSPEEIFAFAVRELSPFVSLRHDRMPYDFTMFIYRK